MSRFQFTFVFVFALAASNLDADIIISEVELAGSGVSKIELVNTGSTTIDLTNYWWCNRVNGSPFYQSVGAASDLYTGPGTTDPNAALSVAAGDRIVLTIPAAFVPTGNGELGLYSSNSFGSSSAIVDYLEWGGDGIRDSVAAAVAPTPIWEDTGNSTDYINVSSITAGYTIQLDVDAMGAELAGNSAGDYTIRPSSFGSIAVPEPSSFLFLSLTAVFGGCWCRYRRQLETEDSE